MSAQPVELIGEEQAVEAACDELLEIVAQLREMGETRDALREQRHAPQKLLMRLYGKDMIARGQQTKRIGLYTLEAGLNPVHVCKCHGAYLRTCPALTDGGEIEIITRGFEPYIRVYQRAEAAA